VTFAASRLPARLNLIVVSAVLLGGALVAWVVAVARMRGMDDGPGTDLGGLGWYVGIWVTMMAAMMLPSVAPMVLLFARVSRERSRRGWALVPTWIFLTGYFVVWTVYGLAAYGAYRVISSVGSDLLAWDGAGPWVAGCAVAAAGVYELTPLKQLCLRHCRSPLHFVLSGWRSGRLGAVRMGVEHGAYCVGCCWGLMVILFALGAMSLLWTTVVAVLIFVQKLSPGAQRLSVPLAVALVGFGVWVAAAPDRVPGLTRPGSRPAMQMSPSGQPEMGNEPKPGRGEMGAPAMQEMGRAK
jgi:predicted metal-binding membrane protein